MGSPFILFVMNIKLVDINKIKPYKNNPRHNDDAVEYVKRSIEEFGMKVPLVIDRNNEIVTGHTRYKACKELGMKEIPCIMADDLSDEQVKAFRLADNKVAEKSSWDYSLLDLELDDITEFDMEDFGFEFSTYEEEEKYKGQETRNVTAVNFDIYEEDECEGKYQMPTLRGVDYVPDRLIGFNYALSSKDKNCGIHFYIDDYQFERLWNDPEHYVSVLKEYQCILTPHYSVYSDYPLVLKLWNTYRGRLLGQYYQNQGITVIPTVYWGYEDSYEYCFDGLPSNSTLSIYTTHYKSDKKAFANGLKELIKRKKPKKLIIYGQTEIPDEDFGKTELFYFKNEVLERIQKR